MLCTVTGVLATPGGAPLASAVAVFRPAPLAGRSWPPGLIVPEAVEVAASPAGLVSVALVPGSYSLRVTQVGREVLGATVTVPPAASARLEDIIVRLPMPQSVFDAAASASAAARFAEEARRTGAGLVFEDGEGSFAGSLRLILHPGAFAGDVTAQVAVGPVTYPIPALQMELAA